MTENELYLVKEYNFDDPLIKKIDSFIDNSIRDCYNKYFHTFDHICDYDLNFTNVTNKESVNFTISDKNMGLYELNKKLATARQRGFIFNQINKLTIKFYSHLRYINISYYLNYRIPMGQRLFFKTLSQNPNYVKTHCTDLNNGFHFACRKWINQLN